MKLTPERYECPDHPVDLTEQVMDALDDDFRPVAYRDRSAPPRPFEVIVECPGHAGSGKHSLTCAGMWTR
jgi:hypothetical protein